jgi:hypothetical protein
LEAEIYDKALDCYTKFIELDSNCAEGYIKRAECFRLMVNKEKDPIRKKKLIDLAEKDEQKAESLK